MAGDRFDAALALVRGSLARPTGDPRDVFLGLPFVAWLPLVFALWAGIYLERPNSGVLAVGALYVVFRVTVRVLRGR